MKPKTILTKDIGEVRDVYMPEVEYKWQLEDSIEKHIKSNLGLEDES